MTKTLNHLGINTFTTHHDTAKLERLVVCMYLPHPMTSREQGADKGALLGLQMLACWRLLLVSAAV